MAISSKEIASRAGVSQATVSRVINNHASVSPTTRRRVLQVIEELGYYPNAAARSLVTNRTSAIGLVVSDVLNPAYFEFVEEISISARGEGYQVLLCNVERDAAIDDAYVNLLLEQHVAGIIFCSITEESKAAQRLVQANVPFVYLNRYQPGVAAHTVIGDNVAGCEQLTRHLLELGHRRVAFIRGMPNASTSQDRERGYRQALAAHGIAVDDALLVTGSYSLSDAYTAAYELLQHAERPTAIVCANDYMALGVLDAAYDLGLHVPAELSVVGYDNMRLAGLRSIGLTTIAQPFQAMARAALDLLGQAIAADNRLDPQQIVYLPQLVVRRTSGPPPVYLRPARRRN